MIAIGWTTLANETDALILAQWIWCPDGGVSDSYLEWAQSVS